MAFQKVLHKYRTLAFSERDKGDRFERLMQAYLQTDPKYAYRFKNVWLWKEFPGKLDLGGGDTGIDLVAMTYEGDYWAIQCKCFQESAVIDKPAVDSFLSTSSREFKDENLRTTRFAHRLWISTTNKWGPNANEAIRNQHPPCTRITFNQLVEAPVDWEKLDQGIHGAASRTPKKTLRPHQIEALNHTHAHFKTADRGKLIMACGTGKTFTALRIAEHETDGKGLILFLVPSIALLGQTLREWSADANEPINAVCICSDPEISRKKTKNEDFDSFSVVDLALPASTDTWNILHQFQHIQDNGYAGLTVVFSTYQSIDVIARAQKELLNQGFPEFDLIICDEAHRTTGVTLAEEDESAFTKVHDNKLIKARKRLYMTATPRLYSDDIKSKAAQAEAVLCSMDDPSLYGTEIYRIGFGEAVERDLLTDYKVLILTLNDKDVPPAVQRMVADKESEINTDDASKLIGCINALSKQFVGDDGITRHSDPEPMRRAVAFCQNIAASKKISAIYNTATDSYVGSLPAGKKEQMVTVSSQHIDGTMSAPARDEMLGWLKAPSDGNECRILTNVRVLSEGVDVPSLDAVLFLSARNSQVDVVQSVGRVMRKAPGKKYGYIIIPVVVPADVEADKALDDNERYKVVWTVLNALRAHDDRFNATVNKIELNRKKPDNILIGRPHYGFDEQGNPWQVSENGATYETQKDIGRQMALHFEELQNVVFARMVLKVGDRRYWEQWAKDVAVIAERQIERIEYLIENKKDQRAAFEQFLVGLQKNINPGITEQQAVEMLAQHIITQPIFEALFEGYSFVKNNAVSKAMQGMLDHLESGSNLAEDSETLKKFYNSVRKRAEGIDNAEGKQRIIIELYDKFFKTAFPKMVEKLGIVYTPVEVVDFIIHSVNDILKKEFDRSISDENIHILDPFTGTGTFMVRLLQSGLIDVKDLERKYKHELHANEIVLLAYYIAAINIENAYHDAWGGDREWGMGDRQLDGEGKDKLNKYSYAKNSDIQRFDRLAGSDEFGGTSLFEDPGLSEGRDIRADEPGKEGGNLDTGQYSRGLRAKEQEGISPLPGSGQWITDRAGDPLTDRPQSPVSDKPGDGNSAQSTQHSWPSIDSSAQIANAQTLTPNPDTPYEPFEGIVLTDTFQLGETDDAEKLFSEMFPKNSERVQRQKKAPLRVIIGNPPYSVGQKSANDNAQNQKYDKLDARIANTYARLTDATNKNSLYDSYIKAFRWSTDRLDPQYGGVIAFVSNGAWVDGNSADGFRKSLEKEFSGIWVFNLRGNARTQGELRQKEAGNVFGSGSRTPIAITLLVKNPKAKADKAVIRYHDIGDYLSREEKLGIVKKFKSAGNQTMPWTTLAPNEKGDWISQRNEVFETFIPIEPEKKFDLRTKSLFTLNSMGYGSRRDAWVFNFSKLKIQTNMKKMVATYNEQVEIFSEKILTNPNLKLNEFINTDPKLISWSSSLLDNLQKKNKAIFDPQKVKLSIYRPFVKQKLYFGDKMIHRRGQLDNIFNSLTESNIIICLSGLGVTKNFSILVTNCPPDEEFIGKSQCFPLYYYEERPKNNSTLFDAAAEEEYIRRDGVSDFILERARKQYGKNVSKEDIFYYVYGFLHSPDYRTAFANDLKKMLPRIPLVEDASNFWAFSQAGRALADLHIHYEKVPPYQGPGFSVEGAEDAHAPQSDPYTLYKVEKMRFPKGQKATDKPDTIDYNSKITIRNIPEKAYEYIVNGKSAIEWIMERYQITVHKESGIKNDPNDWAREVGNPRYILDLLLSIINVSIQTVEIVEGLPRLEFEE